MDWRDDHRTFDAETFAAVDFKSEPAKQKNAYRAPHRSKEDFAEKAFWQK